MSFRYHVVSLVAVFLALAAGVALGGGPLSELGRTPEPKASAVDDRAQQEAVSAARFADEVVDGGAARLYADGLSGRSVALVTFPGVPDATAAAAAEQVTLAGGTVAGRYAVAPALVDGAEKALVDTLGSQLLTQLQQQDAAAGLTATAPTYERTGELIGLAVATTNTKGGGALGPAGTAVLQSLAGAELMTTPVEPTAHASYVLVLLGPDTEPTDDPIYTGLLTGLARKAVGVTVAADSADGLDGRLSRLRREPVAESLATVDGVEHSPGRTTAILALTQWPETKGGSFGASGADGAVTLR